MTLTVLGILIFVVIVLIGALISVALVFSRVLQRVADHADRVHDRSVEQLGDVLDRLTARTLGEYKAYSLGKGDHGTVEYPEEQGSVWDVPGVFVPTGGLAGGRLEVGVEEGGDDE